MTGEWRAVDWRVCQIRAVMALSIQCMIWCVILAVAAVVIAAVVEEVSQYRDMQTPALFFVIKQMCSSAQKSLWLSTRISESLESLLAIPSVSLDRIFLLLTRPFSHVMSDHLYLSILHSHRRPVSHSFTPRLKSMCFTNLSHRTDFCLPPRWMPSRTKTLIASSVL